MGAAKKGKAPARNGSSGESGEEGQDKHTKPKKRKAKAAEGEGPPRKRKKRKPSPPQEEAEQPELSQEGTQEFSCGPQYRAEYTVCLLLARRMRLDKQLKEVLKPAKRAKKRTKANEDDVRCSNDRLGHNKLTNP